MDMLRKPWLGRVIRETLTEIVQWRNSDSPGKTKDNYRIVGDSVWVKMGKCDPLQIVKVRHVCFSYNFRVCVRVFTGFCKLLTHMVDLVLDIRRGDTSMDL
jgi:hypothetical protein